MKHKNSVGDYVFYACLGLIMSLLTVIVIYPFLNSLAISLNDSTDTMRGGISVVPRIFTLRNYELIFQNAKIYTAYFITVARTVAGTALALLATMLFSFGMAHANLKGRKVYTLLTLIPMYFGGGLIPYYFLIRELRLINNFLVYIIPMIVNIWEMILMRSYFQSLPISLEESARIDGANAFTVLFRIIAPLSLPIIATITLFVGVMHWNSWFDAAMFVTKQELKPMQSVLLSIISEAKFAEAIAKTAAGRAVDLSNVARRRNVNVRSITMATMIVTILPIVCVYPFLQRYFIKGIMIGSIKG